MALPERRRRGRPIPSIPRWDPFTDLEDMYQRMGRLLGSGIGAEEGEPRTAGWSMPVDLEDDDDAFVVQADLPGVRAEDVGVELRDTELTIEAEIKEHERHGVLRHQGRRSGRFDYRLTLPGDVKQDKVEAKLSDGVLTLRLPKASKTQPRRIQVKGG